MAVGGFQLLEFVLRFGHTDLELEILDLLLLLGPHLLELCPGIAAAVVEVGLISVVGLGEHMVRDRSAEELEGVVSAVAVYMEALPDALVAQLPVGGGDLDHHIEVAHVNGSFVLTAALSAAFAALAAFTAAFGGRRRIVGVGIGGGAALAAVGGGGSLGVLSAFGLTALAAFRLFGTVGGLEFHSSGPDLFQHGVGDLSVTADPQDQGLVRGAAVIFLKEGDLALLRQQGTQLLLALVIGGHRGDPHGAHIFQFLQIFLRVQQLELQLLHIQPFALQGQV